MFYIIMTWKSFYWYFCSLYCNFLYYYYYYCYLFIFENFVSLWRTKTRQMLKCQWQTSWGASHSHICHHCQFNDIFKHEIYIYIYILLFTNEYFYYIIWNEIMHFKMINLCMYCQWIWLDTFTVSHLFSWLRSDESEYLKSLAAFVLFDLWFVLHKRQHEIWCLHTWSIHLRSVSRSSFVVHASEMFCNWTNHKYLLCYNRQSKMSFF